MAANNDDQAIRRIQRILESMPASEHRNSVEFLLEMLEARRDVDAQEDEAAGQIRLLLSRLEPAQRDQALRMLEAFLRER